MARLVSRGCLTDDADRIIAVLAERLAWPVGTDVSDADGGCRRVRMGANLSQGAKLELVQPRDAATHEAKFLAAWCPGAYAVRISVHHLDAQAHALRSRGTRFEEDPATAHCPRRLPVAAAATPGAPPAHPR